ncbi:L,D-transpeptidase family protein [Sphingosinicella terrae]|uniref:L,D-transpeptidase family protein n=1 Tax=Sphingosinicella terrae TaxID=2172047 RepID=UPI000E0DF60B|nr:L,D-transpeptidase family protein [Sphingosinicella terrae]
MRKRLRLLRALALAGGFAAIAAYGSLPSRSPAALAVAAPEPARALDLGPEISGFYLERDFRPLWVVGSRLRPEAYRLLAMATETGTVTAELRRAVAAAVGGERHALARADLLLTAAFADHLRAIHPTPALVTMRYVDDQLAPEPLDLRAWLDEAAAMPLDDVLKRAGRTNPALDGLRRGLDVYRRRWSALPQFEIPVEPELRDGAAVETARRLRRRLGVAENAPDAALADRLRDFQRVHGLAATGRPDAATLAALNRGAAHYERLILANIERARAIPVRRGRYILVDAASARLWTVEDGRLTGSMRVVVGKVGMQTPAMAGLLRFAVLNPYWNLPPDLIRDRARKALRRGPAAIEGERLQVLTDWSRSARTLSPRRVDWRAVASGRRYVNLRQRPGPHNMMGAVKFMMPNDLGIYLHDTPLREHFSHEDRRISSGCVRLEDAPRLARWLFGGTAPQPSGAAEQRVDLPEPVPVYITYLTVLPTGDGVRFGSDPYRRDHALLSRLPDAGVAAAGS